MTAFCVIEKRLSAGSTPVVLEENAPPPVNVEPNCAAVPNAVLLGSY